MSEVLYQSETVLVRQAADKTGGIELFMQQTDVVGSKYLSWVGRLEDGSSYAAVMKELVRQLKELKK